MSDTIEVFIAYSKHDKEWCDGLLTHLHLLKVQGIITWCDRQILPGTEWDDEIKAHLNAADIILLLISADFLATDYCTQVEIPEALRRHQAGEAIVMPVILRECDWEVYTPLAAIQAYPEKAKPIKNWADIDEAYTSVTRGVSLAATEIKKRRSQRRQATEQEKLCQAEPFAGRVKKFQAVEFQQFQQWQKAAARPAEAELNQQGQATLKGDYARLEALLKAGDWKAADQETAKQMCQVMGRPEEGWLEVEDIQQFPCADLRAIDQLWVKYSDGKFGFSVQKQIWQDFGSPIDCEDGWEKFGDRIGWRKGLLRREWRGTNELTFDTSAPKGHLPFRYGVGFNLEEELRNWRDPNGIWQGYGLKTINKLFSRRDL